MPSLPEVVVDGRPIAGIIHNGAAELRKGFHMFYRLSIHLNVYSTCLKAVMYVIPPNLSCLSVTELLRLLVAAVKPPRGTWILQRSHLGKGGGGFLQYSDAISPEIPVETIPDNVPSPRGPQESGEGAGALRHDFWGAGIVHLG